MKSLYLNITYKCNCNCIFCAADVNVSQKELALSEIETVLNEAKISSGDRIIINGGEPTVHPELLKIIHLCKKTGANILLFTNGVRLSDMELTSTLVKLGVNKFSIPIYSNRQEVHDSLTRNAGSFANLQKGLRNLMSLKESYSFEVDLKTLLMKPNYGSITGLLEWIKQNYHNYDRLYISGLIISHTAKTHSVELNFADAEPHINEAVDFALKNNMPILFESVPLCLLTKQNLIFYMVHRKKLVQNNSGINEFLYYDNEKNIFEHDQFNDLSSACIYKDCSIYKICRLNPYFFGNQNMANIKPVCLRGVV